MPPANPRKPEQDNSRNEYIPSFISKKPFYVADDDKSSNDPSSADYLEHQRLQRSEATAAEQRWYDRGKKHGPAATKFRKGACENCGAIDHKKENCLERPRKQGARWTGKDIAADAVVQDVNMGWDAKRDRWNGYDAKEYDKVVEEYDAYEDLKKMTKSSDPIKLIGDGNEEDDEEKKEDDGVRYEEETDMGRQQSTSTRNLRIREDTAKYLVNLDLDSAKYDPKTRSMVDAGATADKAAAMVAEDGFMKASGDAAEFEREQKYAWETQERGDKNKIHLQANPTSGEYLRRKEREESAAKLEEHQKALLEKYGNQEHLRKNPLRGTAVIESQRFVEYDEKGLIKGAPKTKAKSQYAEDIMINNHTSVWGSWWRNFQWGYACCHSTTKNSYCTGEEGIRAMEETDRLRDLEDMPPADAEEIPKQIAWAEEAAREEHVPNGVEDDRKVKMAIKAKKRNLDSMRDGVTDEDMEMYRKRRIAEDDPMRSYLGKDEIV